MNAMDPYRAPSLGAPGRGAVNAPSASADGPAEAGGRRMFHRIAGGRG